MRSERTLEPPSASRYTGLRMTDLGFGAGLAVWSFRACATGHGHCPPVVEGMNRALGPLGDEGRVHCLSLARTLAEFGRRTIHLTTPGCLGVTYDEVSLIAALDAAQSGCFNRRDAQLFWLIGRKPDADVSDAVQRFAALLKQAGHDVQRPQSFRPKPRPETLRQA